MITTCHWKDEHTFQSLRFPWASTHFAAFFTCCIGCAEQKEEWMLDYHSSDIQKPSCNSQNFVNRQLLFCFGKQFLSLAKKRVTVDKGIYIKTQSREYNCYSRARILSEVWAILDYNLCTAANFHAAPDTGTRRGLELTVFQSVCAHLINCKFVCKYGMESKRTIWLDVMIGSFRWHILLHYLGLKDS